MGRRWELNGVFVGDEVTHEVTALDEATRSVDPVVVAGALPAERIRARVDHVVKSKRVYATLTAVESASPSRRAVACPQFLVCGGCDLLHADLAFQHDFKRRTVAEALGVELAQVDPVLHAPEEFGYRAFAKFVVGPRGELGSYRTRSHEVVSMEGCVVHAPIIEAVADELRPLLLGTRPKELRYVLMRASLTTQQVVVEFVVSDEDAPETRRLAKALFEACPAAVRTMLHVNDAQDDALRSDRPSEFLQSGGRVEETIGGLSFDLESGAFAQVNPRAAALLYARVTDMIAPAGKRIIDLYAGSGGIALTLARVGAAEVHAIDSQAEGVAAIEASCAKNGITNVVGRVGTAEAAQWPKADAMVVNPPRKGLSIRVAERVCERVPADLVYVSCAPKSLARDLAALSVAYDIAGITPVDLFPQTRHIETVVHLTARPHRA